VHEVRQPETGVVSLLAFSSPFVSANALAQRTAKALRTTSGTERLLMRMPISLLLNWTVDFSRLQLGPSPRAEGRGAVKSLSTQNGIETFNITALLFVWSENWPR